MNRRAPPVGTRRLTTLKAFVFVCSIGVLLDGVLEPPMEASAGEERYLDQVAIKEVTWFNKEIQLIARSPQLQSSVSSKQSSVMFFREGVTVPCLASCRMFLS